MHHQPQHRRAAAQPQPSRAAALDALLLDDEDDEFLDHHLAALREADIDYCSL